MEMVNDGGKGLGGCLIVFSVWWCLGVFGDDYVELFDFFCDMAGIMNITMNHHLMSTQCCSLVYVFLLF